MFKPMFGWRCGCCLDVLTGYKMKKPKRGEYVHAEYVLMHALWQKSRGRNPSVSFMGERNPRKALGVAWMVFHFEGLCLCPVAMR